MDNLMAQQLTYLQTVALWPIQYTKFLGDSIATRWLSLILNFLFGAFIHFLCLHILVLLLVTLSLNFDVLVSKYPDVISNTIIYFTAYAVLLFFQVKYREHRSILEYMARNFRERSAPGLTYVTFDEAFKLAKRSSQIWFWCCLIGTMHYAIDPLFNEQRVLPLRCWYPFNVLKSPAYEVVYVTQVLAQAMMATLFADVGLHVVSIVFLTCSQFDMLYCSLRNIRHTAMMLQVSPAYMRELRKIQNQIPTLEAELNQYYISSEALEDLDTVINCDYLRNMRKEMVRHCPEGDNGIGFLSELDDELISALKDCCDHYDVIVTFGGMIRLFYNLFLLLKVLQVTYLLCFLAYLFSVTASKSIRSVISIVEYLMLSSGELFFMSYAGEGLKTHSVRSCEALLRSSWYRTGKRFRKAMLIFMATTQKPCYLSGAGFFDVDLNKFKGALSASFSYFTLLKKVATD